MESSPEGKAAPAQPESEQKTNVWRGTPRLWERCVFCELKKECSAAGVVRGTRACAEARYSGAKR